LYGGYRFIDEASAKAAGSFTIRATFKYQTLKKQKGT